MAVEKGPYLDWTVLANADFAKSAQFTAVKFNGGGSDTVVAISGATDLPLGILNNAPKKGEEADVKLFGIQKVRLGGTVARDDLLTIAADGRIVKATVGTDATKYVIGRALEGGAAGRVISAAINFTNPYLAK
jgi:hypothetical protein